MISIIDYIEKDNYENPTEPSAKKRNYIQRYPKKMKVKKNIKFFS